METQQPRKLIKPLEVKIFNDDGTIRWNLLIKENGSDGEPFYVTENSKNRLFPYVLIDVDTAGEALHNFLEIEDSLIKGL